MRQESHALHWSKGNKGLVIDRGEQNKASTSLGEQECAFVLAALLVGWGEKSYEVYDLYKNTLSFNVAEKFFPIMFITTFVNSCKWKFRLEWKQAVSNTW